MAPIDQSTQRVQNSFGGARIQQHSSQWLDGSRISQVRERLHGIIINIRVVRGEQPQKRFDSTGISQLDERLRGLPANV